MRSQSCGWQKNYALRSFLQYCTLAMYTAAKNWSNSGMKPPATICRPTLSILTFESGLRRMVMDDALHPETAWGECKVKRIYYREIERHCCCPDEGWLALREMMLIMMKEYIIYNASAPHHNHARHPAAAVQYLHHSTFGIVSLLSSSFWDASAYFLPLKT